MCGRDRPRRSGRSRRCSLPALRARRALGLLPWFPLLRILLGARRSGPPAHSALRPRFCVSTRARGLWFVQSHLHRAGWLSDRRPRAGRADAEIGRCVPFRGTKRAGPHYRARNARGVTIAIPGPAGPAQGSHWGQIRRPGADMAARWRESPSAGAPRSGLSRLGARLGVCVGQHRHPRIRCSRSCSRAASPCREADAAPLGPPQWSGNRSRGVCRCGRAPKTVQIGTPGRACGTAPARDQRGPTGAGGFTYTGIP